MKKLLYLLSFINIGLFAQAQNGLENIIVEKYYISTAADATGSAGHGTLPVGSITYRIYADMLPGYKFQMAYGNANHNLKFTTTTTFYNNTDGYNSSLPTYSKGNAAKNTVMLDSWLSTGAACNNNLGVVKTEDNGVNNVVNINGILHNNAPEMGIPLTTQDGLLAGTTSNVYIIGMDASVPADNGADAVFGDGSANGNSFILTGSAWASLAGTQGPTATNRVLIAQITTNGVFHYELNIQIGTPTGGTENYVSSNPTMFNGQMELTMQSLTGTFDALPTAFAVTGSGLYCQGGAGLSVGLANSEYGVTYTLTPGGATLVGTGSAISFGNKLAGTYAISGTNSNGTRSMTGSAVIIVNTPTVPTFTQLGPYSQGAIPGMLPLISLNNYTGTWNPSTINTTVVGTQSYTFTPIAGQCATTALMNVIVNSATKTLNLKLFLEGLYSGGGMMHEAIDYNPVTEDFPMKWGAGIADTVTVVLYDDAYGAVMAKYPGVYLHTDGNLSIQSIVSSLNGSYYITIFPRNSVPITSATPISFAGNNISYDFTYPIDQAYGAGLNPQKNLGDSFYGMYTGEQDHDSYYAIDGSDVSILDPDIISGPYGYLLTDLNGDGVVDGSDMSIMDANSIFGPLFWNPTLAKRKLHLLNQNN